MCVRASVNVCERGQVKVCVCWGGLRIDQVFCKIAQFVFSSFSLMSKKECNMFKKTKTNVRNVSEHSQKQHGSEPVAKLNILRRLRHFLDLHVQENDSVLWLVALLLGQRC